MVGTALFCRHVKSIEQSQTCATKECKPRTGPTQLDIANDLHIWHWPSLQLADIVLHGHDTDVKIVINLLSNTNFNSVQMTSGWAEGRQAWSWGHSQTTGVNIISKHLVQHTESPMSQASIKLPWLYDLEHSLRPHRKFYTNLDLTPKNLPSTSLPSISCKENHCLTKQHQLYKTCHTNRTNKQRRHRSHAGAHPLLVI